MSGEEAQVVRVRDTVMFSGWCWRTEWKLKGGDQVKTGRSQIRRSFPAIVVAIGDHRTGRPYKVVDADGPGQPRDRSWLLASRAEIEVVQ